MRRLILLTFAFLWLLSLVAYSGDVNERVIRLETEGDMQEGDVSDIKHVLVLNAYHDGFEWTDNQTQAIVDTLKAYNENIIISIEYLDWKHYPTQENLDYHYEILKYKYINEDIDVIIGTDDLGMQFAIDHREEIFDNAPLVFTAVFEDSALQRMGNESNITGVYEKTDVAGTIDLLFDMHPEIEHVYIVRDNSESAEHLDLEIRHVFHELLPEIKLTSLNDYTFDEIKEVMQFPIDNSAVIIGSYNSDAAGFQLPNETFCQEFADITHMPIYSVYEYLYDFGIVGGSLLSGRLQGEMGAKLAIRILDGESADTIAPISEATVYYGVDYEELLKVGLTDRDIPDYVTRIINRRESVFSMYKVPILSVIVLIAILMFSVVILMINVRHRKKVERELLESHEKLQESNDSLVQSELKLKQQNDALQQQQERINFLAYNDYLTGLPNRLETKRYSEKMMALADQNNEKLMVAFIDLDNFKYINTSYGHKAGDIILEQLSGRFNTLTSKMCQIGRIGGDEFVCLARANNMIDFEAYIYEINRLFLEHFTVLEQNLYLSASIGYSIYPDDAMKYDDLLVRADMAMFKMKEQGKSQAGRFDMYMDYEMNRKISIVNEMHDAIENDEFNMLYQPQYDLYKDQIVGYEALIRWENPKLGSVGPDEFIDIAESNGLIVPIGEWVLREAVYFAKIINLTSEKPICIAVNISVVQLMQKDFVQMVCSVLEEIEVEASLLEFEITESVFIESFDIVRKQLDAISSMGIRIALDDFGTGYSSLTYLKKLPLSTLKIDKDFISDITKDDDGHSLTQYIIDIGLQLGYKVVAEGVEEEYQKQYLLQHDCPIMQGYLFSKPINRADAITLIEDLYSEEIKDA